MNLTQASSLGLHIQSPSRANRYFASWFYNHLSYPANARSLCWTHIMKHNSAEMYKQQVPQPQEYAWRRWKFLSSTRRYIGTVHEKSGTWSIWVPSMAHFFNLARLPRPLDYDCHHRNFLVSLDDYDTGTDWVSGVQHSPCIFTRIKGHVRIALSPVPLKFLYFPQRCSAPWMQNRNLWVWDCRCRVTRGTLREGWLCWSAACWSCTMSQRIPHQTQIITTSIAPHGEGCYIFRLIRKVQVYPVYPRLPFLETRIIQDVQHQSRHPNLPHP